MLLAIAEIRQQLNQRPPRLVEDPAKTPAAVAALLREGSGDLELLLIERARIKGDPWSGHLGFPGGKVEEGDGDLRQTAERETREELGVDPATGDFLGRLDDLTGATLPVSVAGFAYEAQMDGELVLSKEVTEAFWVPARELGDRERHRRHHFTYRGGVHEHDVIDLGGSRPLLWGLTYRFVAQLLGLGRAPVR